MTVYRGKLLRRTTTPERWGFQRRRRPIAVALYVLGMAVVAGLLASLLAVIQR